MSAVEELIQDIKAAGITLRVDPPDLVVRPADRLTPHLETRLREHKAEILRRRLEVGTTVAETIRINPSIEEQRESLQRLIDGGAAYIQITSTSEDVYIALTDSAYHELSQRQGLTVYHAAHLIELTVEEIRLMHSLRTLKGSGGSVQILDSIAEEPNAGQDEDPSG